MANPFPNERINIRYTQRKNGQEDETLELPLKLLAIGNFHGNASGESDTPVGERQPCAIRADNFYDVMEALPIGLDISVANHLLPAELNPQDLKLHLNINSLADFHPDALIEKVPELHQLLILKNLFIKLRQAKTPQQVKKAAKSIQEHLSTHGLEKESP